MYFDFTPEQYELRDSLKTFLRQTFSTDILRKTWEGDQALIYDLWKKMGSMGLTGLALPQAHGGQGLRPTDWILIVQDMGYVAIPLPVVESILIAAPTLAQNNHPLLDSLLIGETFLTYQQENNPLVPFAQLATKHLYVSPSGLHLLGNTQVEKTDEKSVDPSRFLSRIKIPNDAIAETTKIADKSHIEKITSVGILATASLQIGLAERLLDMAVAYVQEREQFGRPVGSFQAIKHMLADALLKLDFAKPMVYRAAHSLQVEHPNTSNHCSMAKIYADEAVSALGKKALQVHGAMGYSFEYDLHLYLKRSWCLQHDFGGLSHHYGKITPLILSNPDSEEIL